MNLYRVRFEVSPTVEHPQFWSWKTGWLFIWLFATSHDNAGERARNILNQLPYEAVEEPTVLLASEVKRGKSEFREAEERDRWGEFRAKEIGVGLLLEAMSLEGENIPPGVDDGPQPI